MKKLLLISLLLSIVLTLSANLPAAIKMQQCRKAEFFSLDTGQQFAFD